MIKTDKLKINTIYIISKGRPECKTAQVLKKIHYPGEWFIVCGNNDEKLPEYQQNWGDKVLVFDWYEQVKETNTLDNFGFEKRASGACPVRNAVRKISWDRGELRHWQFDDDFNSFTRYSNETHKNTAIKDGAILFSSMYRIAEYAYKADLTNIGFSCSDFHCYPSERLKYNLGVGCTHNQSSDPSKWVEWVGRGVDDFIHTYNVFKSGGYELNCHYLQFTMPLGAGANTSKIKCGLEEFRNDDGMIKRFAYIFLMMPGASTLRYNKGLYKIRVSWKNIFPKLLHEKWRKPEVENV